MPSETYSILSRLCTIEGGYIQLLVIDPLTDSNRRLLLILLLNYLSNIRGSVRFNS